MQLIEFFQRRRLLAGIALGALLGALLGLLRPIGGDAGDAPAASIEWTLEDPAAFARFDEQAFQTLRRAPIWGSDAAGTARNRRGAPQTRSWRLTGIIAEPAPTALIVVDGETDIKRLQIGDSLPDGSTVVAISERGLGFEHDGCRKLRALYAPPDADSGGDCDPSPPAATKKSDTTP